MNENEASFTASALALSSHAALILHWRPDDFWFATPAELAAILAPLTDQPAPPDLKNLMERFPDAPEPKREA